MLCTVVDIQQYILYRPVSSCEATLTGKLSDAVVAHMQCEHDTTALMCWHGQRLTGGCMMETALDHVPWEAVRSGRAGRASKALATVSMSILKVR